MEGAFMRVEIGYKFIIGFILVIGAVVIVPQLARFVNLPEGMEQIVSTLVAVVVGLTIGSVFSSSPFASKSATTAHRTATTSNNT